MSAAALDRLLANRAQFLSFVRKRVSTPESAEDILQAAFVKGLERGGEDSDEESAVRWFYRVLRNAIIDHYRRDGAARRALEELAAEPMPEPVREEVCGCLGGAIDALKPEYRDALRLVDLAERPLAELAREAGITEGNAAVRVHRARAALRKRIAESCGACATHGCLDCQCKKGCGEARSGGR